jgi:hypothetical protein
MSWAGIDVIDVRVSFSLSANEVGGEGWGEVARRVAWADEGTSLWACFEKTDDELESFG